MKKTYASLMLLAVTLLWCSVMLAGNAEPPAPARIVTTERRDVYQTIGLLGQIAYADEAIILAQRTGRIEDVCVSPGERLAAGSKLASYDAAYQDEVVSAYATHLTNTDAVGELLTEVVSKSIQRASVDCTVREVYVEAGAYVTAGTPLMRVSGTGQEIRCVAAAADAKRITEGMWAWIHEGDERIGYAFVQGVEKWSSDTVMPQYVITLTPEQTLDLEEGSIVEISVYIAGSNDVVALPLEAVTDRETVWWVRDDGRCTEIPAEIVLCDESCAWVNLPEGIRVAVGEFCEGQLLTGEAA